MIYAHHYFKYIMHMYFKILEKIKYYFFLYIFYLNILFIFTSYPEIRFPLLFVLLLEWTIFFISRKKKDSLSVFQINRKKNKISWIKKSNLLFYNK